MDVTSFEDECVLTVRRWNADSEILVIFNFGSRESHALRNIPSGTWRKRLDSSESRWLGQGAVAPDVIQNAPSDGLRVLAHGVLLYEKEHHD